MGVGDRQCGEQIPARSKRCQDCRAENERLLKQAANSRYFQRHREALNEKRRNRRRKKQELARREKLAAEVRAMVKRTAALPRLVSDGNGRPLSWYDPVTGERRRFTGPFFE